MKKDLAQLNIIEDILNLIDTAWSTNTKSSKLMLNFSADLSLEDQVNLLNDLKKKQAIQDFKKQTDYFDLFSPSHDILLREYDRLKPRYQEVKLPTKPAAFCFRHQKTNSFFVGLCLNTRPVNRSTGQ